MPVALEKAMMSDGSAMPIANSSIRNPIQRTALTAIRNRGEETQLWLNCL
jgi:hypothetical protein